MKTNTKMTNLRLQKNTNDNAEKNTASNMQNMKTFVTGLEPARACPLGM